MSAPATLVAVFERAFQDRRVRLQGGALELTSVRQRARVLAEAKLSRREAVGMVFDNGAACVETYAALAVADLVAVPFPPTLPEGERLRLWSSAGCRWYVDEAGLHPLPSTARPTPTSSSDAVAGDPIAWPDDVHWVMHSSGSTGIPKAIPLTYDAVRRNAIDVMELLGLGTDLAHLGSMSQCYTNGLFNSFLLPLITGGTCVVGPVASALKVRQYLELIRAERPQILWVNPTVVSMLARNPSADDFRDVRVLISCTAPLDQRLCVTAEAAFGKPVLQSFGTTETLIVSVESPGRDAGTAFSSGQIVGGAGAVSIDDDGVLRIHNGAVTPGYASCVGGRVETSLPGGGIPGQLFVSGDLARLTEAGNLEIVGRTTNVINVGGVKISVEQLEEILRSDPSVVEAAVTALAGADGDEKPIAFVSARGPVDRQRLIDACVQRLGSKARLADVRVVPAIPLTANGKIDRVALAKKLAP